MDSLIVMLMCAFIAGIAIGIAVCSIPFILDRLESISRLKNNVINMQEYSQKRKDRNNDK